MRIASYHPLAERELNDAIRFYELESPGLGLAFLTEVERVLAIMNMRRRPGYWVDRS